MAGFFFATLSLRRGMWRTLFTSVDQSVEFESVPPCCSENISDKRVIAEDKVSAEVDEKKSLEKDLACSLGSEKTCSGNNDGLIGESDETSKNHNVDMLGGTDLKELHNEANDELCILDIREENIGNGPSLPSDGDPSMYHEEQCVASEADLSLELLDDSKGVPADRTSTGYKVKKLLVLDVNGLLVHICPYIPYNYNPDDIIMMKAVFKRPHCDDFLKFCFENFNVGIWTS